MQADRSHVLGCSSRGRAALISTAIAVGIANTAVAQADPLAGVAIRWNTPAECPDRAALEAAIRRDLAGSQSNAQRLVVDADVERHPSGIWYASVSLQNDSQKSTRRLDARSCSEVAEATSLIVAMVIDPDVAVANQLDAAKMVEGGRPVPDDTRAEVSSDAPSTASSAVIAPSQPTNTTEGTVSKPLGVVVPSENRRWGTVSGWVAVDSGSLPYTAVAYGGALGFLSGRWRAEASFGAWVPQDKTADGYGTPGPGGHFSVVAGGARLCAEVLRAGAVGIGPCAGAEIERWTAEGNVQLAGAATTHLWSGSAVLMMLATLEIASRLSIRLDLQTAAAAARPKFGFTQYGEQIAVFQPDRMLWRLGVAAELRFH